MSRLSLAAVLLLAAARFAAAAPPTSDEILAAAAAQQDAGCKAVPASCPELTAIHDGYRAELHMLAACATGGKCKADEVFAAFGALEALDRREGDLPAAARSTDGSRPLLRLSLLLSKDATQVYAMIAPGNAIETFSRVAAFAPKDVNEACALATKGTACDEALQSLELAQDVDARASACEKRPPSSPCGFDELDGAAQSAEESTKRYERAADAGVNVMTLFSYIKADEDRLSLMAERNLREQGNALVAGIADLSAKTNALAAGGDASAAEARFNSLSDNYRRASIDADRLASFGYADAATVSSYRDKLNAAATRLAEIRGTLAAADAGRLAAGLEPAAADPGAVPAGAPAGAAAGAKAPAFNASPGVQLDRRLIPAPPPVAASAPPIIPGSPSVIQLAENLASGDPLKVADARRRAGLSYTVGDPSGRAGLVHAQKYDNSCAIVAQQEVLASLRLVSAADPVKTETALATDAVRRGFFNKGTPSAYEADLLVDRKVLVVKETRAPLADLDAAVRRGGLVIASADARYLWNKVAPSPLGHAIVITGAQVDRAGGKTEGYYINDSGTDPPGAGRFVPIATFTKAWNAYTKDFAEVK